MNGSRSAAISGGRTAFRIAITAAATKAPQKLFTSAPGTIQAATSSAIVETSQVTTTRTGRSRGTCGPHTGVCP